MTREEFELPDVGEGIAEGELVNWIVEEGDTVTEDQPVAEVETDKAVVDVPSPFDATVAELRAEEGEMVPVGDVIVVFDTDGGEESTDTADGTSEDDTTAETGTVTEAAPAAENGDSEVADGRVFAPPSARREARERGVDVTAVEGTGPSGRITVADVRDHAESAADAPEPKSVDIDAGESVVSGDGAAGSSANGASAATNGASTADGAGAVESADRDRTLAAPATRRVADEEGVDLDAVPTDERRDGEAFVDAEQVEAYATAQREAQAADAATTGGDRGSSASVSTADASTGAAASVSSGSSADSGSAAATTDGVADTVAYRGVRQTIGEKMAESKYTAPHVTHHDTATVDDLVDTRERLAQRAAERDVSLTYMPFVVKAVVDALREFPILNSRLDEDDEQILIRDDYHVGIAVATDAGLMVPVVENADQKGLVELSSEIADLAARARDRELAPEELRGSTFTISNFGVFGGEYATPIINYPETAILGIGELDERPVAKDGELRAAPTMPLSVSIDHRVVDGAEAAQFTNAVMDRLESPELLLL
ncbi:MAG: pyruvate/2-oxoglutarate dehydrogenase complex, dihydrolipoamide acyltransferase (E2) component [halophilic archaeon J07HB67]|jgi:Pyruvate/2-oxoglutarate dehydrogenase complex, dihydrolipoamide acyltransferase (E2) component, and related enzymes|nr:MAG: pyruvate/2-oxoglutarate dehydrogenase complex, dihydrolipoamide acyltransferase (E2) component [halophilic archaeon J07HB67]